MSNLQSGASEAQMIELFNSIKFPIMGAGGGFAPIGTINFFDASIAPQGWLACDGSVVNIADYPDLATYYASVHGSANFYGGNGTTTFAVPDLRGEFLRGTGTNSHTNQGDGASVGEHQDGTEDVNIGVYNGQLYTYAPTNKDTTWLYTKNLDSEIIGVTSTQRTVSTAGAKSTDTGSWTTTFTSRPTNTSFLICVKATDSDNLNPDEEIIFDETGTERRIGYYKYANGTKKPVYEKSIYGTKATTKNQDAIFSGAVPNYDTIIDYKIGSKYNNECEWEPNSCYVASNGDVYVKHTWSSASVSVDWYITLRYTKTTDTPS